MIKTKYLFKGHKLLQCLFIFTLNSEIFHITDTAMNLIKLLDSSLIIYNLKTQLSATFRDTFSQKNLLQPYQITPQVKIAFINEECVRENEYLCFYFISYKQIC